MNTNSSKDTHILLKETKNLDLYLKILKIIRFSVLRVSYKFLEGSEAILMFTSSAPVNLSKQGFLKPFQCVWMLPRYLQSNVI